MVFVQPLTFGEARETVLSQVRGSMKLPGTERTALACSAGRVLASDVVADRAYPPLPRSIRDGFAVKAADFPGSVRVIGEVRAGEVYPGVVGPREAVEIMTGAPVPEGADAVIMVEHVSRSDGEITTERKVAAGDFIVPAGAESRAGDAVLHAGTRIDFGHLACLATVGHTDVEVFRQPVVSIVATGDEIVPVDAVPAPHQIRNSNSHTLSAQVARTGAVPRLMPVAPDEYEQTRFIVEKALEADLLLLSGGVSAGKYDLVEKVLSDLGAEFYFDRVLIQPGQPLVFGRVRDRFFFGLPGNPISTMVTFELFARAALDLLAGCTNAALPLLFARLTSAFGHKPGLTRFLPAVVNGGEVSHVPWQGSGDVFSVGRANAFLVARDDRAEWKAGEPIEVLMR